MIVCGFAHADSLKSQIDAANTKVNDAMMKKDFVKLRQSLANSVTPDFVYEEAGHKIDFDKMFATMKMGINQMGKLTLANSKILTIDRHGDIATCTTKRSMGGNMPGPDKKTHLIVYSGVSEDTYRKVGSQWKMSKMLWKNTSMTVDGKPMKSPPMSSH
jgi:hypothetical protein